MSQASDSILKTLQIGLASLIAVSNISPADTTTSKIPEPIAKAEAQAPAATERIPENKEVSTIITMIRETSAKYGVDDDLAVAIARCESNLLQYNANGAVVRGRVNPKDVGVFQINEDFHLRQSQEQGFDIYTTRGNIEYAVSLLKKSGNKPWVYSKSCWANHVAMK